jgi:hypothetical protein
MELLSEGTRFAMLRQMISNPTHSVVMAALMAGVAAGDDVDAVSVILARPGGRGRDAHC